MSASINKTVLFALVVVALVATANAIVREDANACTICKSFHKALTEEFHGKFDKVTIEQLHPVLIKLCKKLAGIFEGVCIEKITAREGELLTDLKAKVTDVVICHKAGLC